MGGAEEVIMFVMWYYGGYFEIGLQIWLNSSG